ncbi:hypothetical protein [Conexibacter sp. DBS9H8]|uniref:hypothetical protein n=1 Tax=Conexibacter sp. DBS9H8 TaxID=2937801 RepID=UPI00200FD087|nr:hypothetical protein [Conexibacter sp. DBS9H8]
MLRLISHLRANVVAYLALGIALGAGGGYAFAANVSRPIHGCVVSRTGELLVRARCGRGQRPLEWDRVGSRGPRGAAGAPGQPGVPGMNAVVAFGQVATNGVPSPFNQGLSIQETSPGVFSVTVTAPACAGANAEQVPVVSAVGSAGPGTPLMWTFDGSSASTFTVYAGQLINGSYTPGDQGFDVMDSCLS